MSCCYSQNVLFIALLPYDAVVDLSEGIIVTKFVVLGWRRWELADVLHRFNNKINNNESKVSVPHGLVHQHKQNNNINSPGLVLSRPSLAPLLLLSFRSSSVGLKNCVWRRCHSL